MDVNSPNILQEIADKVVAYSNCLLFFCGLMFYFQKLLIYSKNVMVKCYRLAGHISQILEVLSNTRLGRYNNINLIWPVVVWVKVIIFTKKIIVGDYHLYH